MNAYKTQSNTLSNTVVHPFPSMDVLGLRRTVCYDDLDTYQKNVQHPMGKGLIPEQP